MLWTKNPSLPLSGVIENPELIAPGSFGVLVAPDWREPDAHKWLAENADKIAADSRYNDIAQAYAEINAKYGGDVPMLTARREAAAFAIRDHYRQLYGFAVPTQEAILRIVQYAPKGVVEIGAGNGYWAYLIRHYGIDVLAYDSHPVEGGGNYYWRWDHTKPGDATLDARFHASWTQVLPGEAGVSEHYPDRALLLVWPPFGENGMSSKALQSYAGDTVIYVGEGYKGCTGDDIFHKTLSSEWEEVDGEELPRFVGLHDRLEVYKR